MKKNKFKHTLNIIIINIFYFILFGFIFVLFDTNLYKDSVYFFPYPLKKTWTTCYNTERLENNLPVNKKKRPIIFVGCSFTYGTDIPQKDTLPYKIQQNTGRKTYNRSYPASGIQHTLYNIQHSDFYKNNSDLNPELFIYTYIPDHIRRLYINYFDMNSRDKYLRYEKQNNELVPIDLQTKLVDYFKVLHLSKTLDYMFIRKKTDDEKFDFFKLHLQKFKEEVEKKYPNSKIAIIIYNDKVDIHGEIPFHTNRWNEIEDMGFIVLNFENEKFDYLNNKEYRSGNHPNGKAWNSLIPIIIEKLHL